MLLKSTQHSALLTQARIQWVETAQKVDHNISSRLSSECIFNTYLEHFFVQCSWRCTLTPPCLCFILFYFGTLGWLFIRCTLVETCETNILTATRHFKFHSLSVILSLSDAWSTGILPPTQFPSVTPFICFQNKMEYLFLPSYCRVSVLSLFYKRVDWA